MWSGLPSPGPSDTESTEDEDDTPTPGTVPAACRAKFRDLQRKRSELEEIGQRQKRKRRKRGKSKVKGQEAPEEDDSPTPAKVPPLEALQKYFGINDHLDPPVCQKVLKTSRLEQSLDVAVQSGNIEEAEEISDQLATRELAVKITKAASCHKYIKGKEQESSQERAKKQKNLPWGFEAKKRWETKSNMGYM